MSIFNLPKNQKGFLLVEILISLFVVVAIVAIFFLATNALPMVREERYKSIALRAASKEIENLRNTQFSLITLGTTNQPLGELPDGQITREITQFGGAPEILNVRITVSWRNMLKPLYIDTLIYESGL